VTAEGFLPPAIDPEGWEQEMYAVRARRDRLADTWYRALAIALCLSCCHEICLKVNLARRQLASDDRLDEL